MDRSRSYLYNFKTKFCSNFWSISPKMFFMIIFLPNEEPYQICTVNDILYNVRYQYGTSTILFFFYLILSLDKLFQTKYVMNQTVTFRIVPSNPFLCRLTYVYVRTYVSLDRSVYLTTFLRLFFFFS